jgi:hypothetical protein
MGGASYYRDLTYGPAVNVNAVSTIPMAYVNATPDLNLASLAGVNLGNTPPILPPFAPTPSQNTVTTSMRSATGIQAPMHLVCNF